MIKIARRFREIIEKGPSDVPDYAWLTFAVCALGEKPCGWSGWLFDGVYRKTAERHSTGTGDKLLPADYSQKCPQCGGDLFRTGVEKRMELSAEQTPPLVPGVDYDVVDNIEYE